MAHALRDHAADHLAPPALHDEEVCAGHVVIVSSMAGYAAVEALKIGFGGIAYVAQVLGMSRRTIHTGIRELEAMKDNLLARMNVIQELQGSRPESVHLMDELVRTLPDGVHLNTFEQKSKALTMTGIAESNARVSDYMREIDVSDWFTGPRLDVIKTTESNRRRIANFTLRGNQKARKPDEETAGVATP